MTDRARAAEEAQANLEALSATCLERDSLKAEIETLVTDRARAAEEAQANLEALQAEFDELKLTRQKAVSDAKSNLAAFEEMRDERDRLKSELGAAQHRLDDQGQATQRAAAELDALRDDNRLSLRIQRIAQADLADLQDRYAALADEKLQLDHFLDELAQNVLQSMSADRLPTASTSSKQAGTRTRSSAKSAAKPARKRTRAKPT